MVDVGLAFNAASHRDLHFGSQSVRRRGQGDARGQRHDGVLVRYVFPRKYSSQRYLTRGFCHGIGLGSSSAVGPTIVGELAGIFLDTLYKA